MRNRLNIPICDDRNYMDYNNFIYKEVMNIIGITDIRRTFYIRYIRDRFVYKFFSISIIKDERIDKVI